MQQFDCIIIGGGIVGLSVPWAILEKTSAIRFAVLEPGWARHQTGWNSGIIHSGIYRKPGSLKAKLCRKVNRWPLEFCHVHGIRYEACGKVVVTTTATEIPVMQDLYERGIPNRLVIKKLNASEVKGFELHVSYLAGIHMPSTGIVDLVGVCRKLPELIGAQQGELPLGTKVQGFRADGSDGILETSKHTLADRWIINFVPDCTVIAWQNWLRAYRAFPG